VALQVHWHVQMPTHPMYFLNASAKHTPLLQVQTPTRAMHFPNASVKRTSLMQVQNCPVTQVQNCPKATRRLSVAYDAGAIPASLGPASCPAC
jgi:hypothetical protein